MMFATHITAAAESSVMRAAAVGVTRVMIMMRWIMLAGIRISGITKPTRALIA